MVVGQYGTRGVDIEHEWTGPKGVNVPGYNLSLYHFYEVEKVGAYIASLVVTWSYRPPHKLTDTTGNTNF